MATVPPRTRRSSFNTWTRTTRIRWCSTSKHTVTSQPEMPNPLNWRTSAFQTSSFPPMASDTASPLTRPWRAFPRLVHASWPCTRTPCSDWGSRISPLRSIELPGVFMSSSSRCVWLRISDLPGVATSYQDQYSTGRWDLRRSRRLRSFATISNRCCCRLWSGFMCWKRVCWRLCDWGVTECPFCRECGSHGWPRLLSRALGPSRGLVRWLRRSVRKGNRASDLPVRWRQCDIIQERINIITKHFVWSIIISRIGRKSRRVTCNALTITGLARTIG